MRGHIWPSSGEPTVNWAPLAISTTVWLHKLCLWLGDLEGLTRLRSSVYKVYSKQQATTSFSLHYQSKGTSAEWS